MVIKWKDLSWPIKVPLVTVWIYLGILALEFIYGFILGFFGI